MSKSISDLPMTPPIVPASARSPEPCPHGLRPGTTVCLHCLREKRVAARGRLYRTAARIGLGALAAVVLMAVGVGALKSMKPRTSRRVATPPTETKRGAVQAGHPRATRTAAARVASPVVASGRTELGQGVFVERAGDSIVVHFDTDTLRTRFDWKFEGVVRSTLPSVFPQSQPVLNAIPQATLVHGDLVEDITRRGVRLDLGAEGALMIWPITRPGQDGPLVVAYRVTAAR